MRAPIGAEPYHLPVQLGAGVGVVVVVVVLVAAFVQTVTGFGFSLVVVPPLGLVIEPADAVAVALVLLVLSNALVAFGERHEVDGPAARWLLAGAVIGLPIGLAALGLASADALRLALAVAVVVTVVVVVTGRPAIGGGAPSLLVAGLCTGALTTSLTTNGPPTVLALQGRGLAPTAFRPTVAVVLGLASVAGTAMFAVDGRLAGDVVPAAAIGVPALVVGWGLGLVARHRLPVAWFRRSVLGLLLAGAVVSVVATVA